MWFHSDHNRIGRECLVPAISRTFHYGTSGAHMKSLLTHAHMSGRLVVSQGEIKLHNLDRYVLKYCICEGGGGTTGMGKITT